MKEGRKSAHKKNTIKKKAFFSLEKFLHKKKRQEDKKMVQKNQKFPLLLSSKR